MQESDKAAEAQSEDEKRVDEWIKGHPGVDPTWGKDLPPAAASIYRQKKTKKAGAQASALEPKAKP